MHSSQVDLIDFYGGKYPPYLMRVLAGACMGKRVKEMATDLELSIYTVENYLREMCIKMHARNRSHMISTGALHGFDNKGNYNGELHYKPWPKEPKAPKAPKKTQ